MYAETAWGRYDNAEAVRWYRHAADAGHAGRSTGLGWHTFRVWGLQPTTLKPGSGL